MLINYHFLFYLLNDIFVDQGKTFALGERILAAKSGIKV
jgi:hypothetical protein